MMMMMMMAGIESVSRMPMLHVDPSNCVVQRMMPPPAAAVTHCFPSGDSLNATQHAV
jgi:hypothetical protein